jgi:4'-phosphopantetheinyl transferase EntD
MLIKKIEYDRSGAVYLTEIAPEDGEKHREAERGAVMRILRHVFGEGVELDHEERGAPIVRADGFSGYVSITHCRSYAAVAVDSSAAVGLDIEEPRKQLANVAPRVLSPSELAIYGARYSGLLQAWTLKEALYKAALTPGLDFRRDIMLPLELENKKASVNTDVETETFDILICNAVSDFGMSRAEAWLSVVRLTL